MKKSEKVALENPPGKQDACTAPRDSAGNGGSPDSLSKRQEGILNFIRTETTRRGYPPTVREICKALGFSSTSSVHRHLESLRQKGLIRRPPNLTRAIEVVNREAGAEQSMSPVPVLGDLSDATRESWWGEVLETWALPGALAPSGASSFIVRQSEDTMVDTGILKDDLLIISSQDEARNGDIVLAQANGRATVQRYFRGPTILHDVRILGKVAVVIRRLDRKPPAGLS
ncbi:MAG: repressor LexA [Armatimonadetes bacterium]|nr:repressor LexA [Armatimonadota bacterium]